MATLRKRWPNEAEWARLDCIALAERIEKLAEPVFAGQPMTEVERVQRAGKTVMLAREIGAKLKGARNGK